MGIEKRIRRLGDPITHRPPVENRSFSVEDLATIHEKQINRLVGLRLHELLNMSEDEYRAGIPSMLPQPDAYRGQFDTPLLIDPRVALPELCQAVGIEYYNHDTSNRDLVVVPNRPYTMWTHDSMRYNGISVATLSQLRHTSIREVPSTLHEVVALYIHYPEFFGSIAISAPGSRNNSNDVPYVGELRSGAFIYDRGINAAASNWGLLSRGEEINVGV